MMMTDIVKSSVGKMAIEKITGEKSMVMGVIANKNENNRETLKVQLSVKGEIETLDFMDFVIKYQIEG